MLTFNDVVPMVKFLQSCDGPASARLCKDGHVQYAYFCNWVRSLRYVRSYDYYEYPNTQDQTPTDRGLQPIDI